MKTNVILFLIGIIFISVQCRNIGESQKGLSKSDQDWIWLFDGISTDMWKDIGSDYFPEHGWKVSDSVLTVLGETEDHPAGHDIVSKEQYSNFELELEARLSPGANSGIKYIVSSTFPGKEGQYLGLEYQLLDNERHPDAAAGRNGNHKMGSLYDLIPAPENSKINPPGAWNLIRIIVDGGHVEHWLNGEKIIEFERDNECFRELVALSKYSDIENFGELDRGHLLLQGHGDEVSFRNIRIHTW